MLLAGRVSVEVRQMGATDANAVSVYVKTGPRAGETTYIFQVAMKKVLLNKKITGLLLG